MICKLYLVHNFTTYPTISKILAIIHRTIWWAVYLDLRRVLACRLSDQPNWGRISNTKPRRKPLKNPPMCAKLSTCGRIPTAKLIAMITTRVNRAAAYQNKEMRNDEVTKYFKFHKSTPTKLRQN